ncbi:intein N-terminal splicing region [Geodermatophilus amargosae]|uniref:Intein N-terminal splicing region n=1 Tax=Geodermatophilus amargosae TaxID=1296565 RepID=A0A1I6Z0Q2_9ACTN|nr:intein-containing Rv2578c family radical SAM protein [Geodermatophilus amargosae]SFT56252.1 intein N-terminal splicing region [Geodermatophilus amargosae]
MRWDARRLDADDESLLPGMPSLRGLLRSVEVPEFPGVTMHEVLCRSALNPVPEGSRMPFSHTINPYRGCLHQCVYCLAGDTRILMADGSQRPISELRVGDRIIGTERRGTYRHYVETEVLAHWGTVKPAHRVTLADGTELTASGDHRFLTRRGWKYVTGTTSGRERRPHLTTNDELMGFGRTGVSLVVCAEYRRGYLAGMIRGDGHLGVDHHERPGRTHDDHHRFRLALVDEEGLDRTQAFLAEEGIRTDRFDFAGAVGARRAIRAIRASSSAAVGRIADLVAWPGQPTAAWQRGFLAGIFDAEGSRSGGALRVSNTDPEILERTRNALSGLDFDAVVEDRRRDDGLATVRVRGGLREHMRFVHLVDPAIRRRCGVEGIAVESDAALQVVDLQALGLEMPMFDITTGTGDFVADGVISHNCFARSTHEWLDLDAGRDFDTQIVVKTNLVEVLRRELAKPSWKRRHVALGTNTDPYQRAEGRYRLMPGVIRALADSGTPLSILTKGTLARRDLPLLAGAAKDVPVGFGVSLAVWDDDLHASLEPGVPSPRARLDLVRAVTDAGLPCGVFLAPVLPGLTDRQSDLDTALGAIAEAGATGVTVVPLHLRPGAREWFSAWLTREHPSLVGRYRQLYRGGAYVPAEYRAWLAERVTPLLRRHGLDGRPGGAARGAEASSGVPGDDEAAFPAGSLPPARDATERPRGARARKARAGDVPGQLALI